MSALAILRVLWPGRAFRRASGGVLRTRFTAEELATLWPEVDAERRRLRPYRLRGHAPGLALLLRYLEWDCALYRVLCRRDWSPSEAGAAITDINWTILGPPIAVAHRVSRLRSRQSGRRVGWLLDALFLLVFSAPFRRRAVAPKDGLSFDVLACPLADYYRAAGVPELTRYAACDLDHRMARDWGMQLLRTRTLADGGAACDFRFRVVVETGPSTARSARP